MKDYKKSKTLIVNTLFILAIIAQKYAEFYIIDPALQGLLLALANDFLRFVTTQGITVPFKKQA